MLQLTPTLTPLVFLPLPGAARGTTRRPWLCCSSLQPSRLPSVCPCPSQRAVQCGDPGARGPGPGARLARPQRAQRHRRLQRARAPGCSSARLAACSPASWRAGCGARACARVQQHLRAPMQRSAAPPGHRHARPALSPLCTHNHARRRSTCGRATAASRTAPSSARTTPGRAVRRGGGGAAQGIAQDRMPPRAVLHGPPVSGCPAELYAPPAAAVGRHTPPAVPARPCPPPQAAAARRWASWAPSRSSPRWRCCCGATPSTAA